MRVQYSVEPDEVDASSLAHDLLTGMYRIRMFEEAAIRLFDRGRIRGAIHLSTGQEAAIVGACSSLRQIDFMTGTHRSHGHPIAKGAALGPLMAELLGKQTGVCRGKGGSMHLADFSVGSLGESGIVAGSIPTSLGAALSSQVLQAGHIAMAFFGDGATTEGVFHESMNIAAVWSLPIVFFCENNGYAATVPADQMTPGGNVAQRACGYGMPGVVVDGQDVLAVRSAAIEAAERARAGLGPTLIDARTYRFDEHAYRLPVRLPYRSVEEVADWRDHRDPITLFVGQCLSEGWLSAEALTAMEAQVSAEIDAAVVFAEESPDPLPEQAFDDLYSEIAS